MARQFADGFRSLDQFSQRIDLERLRDWLLQSEVLLEDVRQYIRFREDRYVRNLVYSGPAYQALLICWRNGQRSPIHDHQGSSCALKVLEGQAMETLFDFAPNGMIFPVSSSTLHEGAITTSRNADKHQMANLQSEQRDLITLHIYSPPLLAMNVYSMKDDRIRRVPDPVNTEFFAGAGI